MDSDDRTLLLEMAFQDWTRLRSTYLGASWRAKLNNFEMSEMDVVVAHMDRVLCAFVAMERERGTKDVPGVMAEKPDHLNGNCAMGASSDGVLTRRGFGRLTDGMN